MKKIIRFFLILGLVITGCTNIPVIKTVSIDTFGKFGAYCVGELISTGGVDDYEVDCGFCWSTDGLPTLYYSDINGIAGANFVLNESENIGIVRHLLPGRTYKIRAFARNEEGFSYGEPILFKTPDLEIGDSFEDSNKIYSELPTIEQERYEIIAYILKPNDPGYNNDSTKGIIVNLSPFYNYITNPVRNKIGLAEAYLGLYPDYCWGSIGKNLGTSKDVGTGKKNVRLIKENSERTFIGLDSAWLVPSLNDLKKILENYPNVFNNYKKRNEEYLPPHNYIIPTSTESNANSAYFYDLYKAKFVSFPKNMGDNGMIRSSLIDYNVWVRLLHIKYFSIPRG